MIDVPQSISFPQNQFERDLAHAVMRGEVFYFEQDDIIDAADCVIRAEFIRDLILGFVKIKVDDDAQGETKQIFVTSFGIQIGTKSGAFDPRANKGDVDPNECIVCAPEPKNAKDWHQIRRLTIAGTLSLADLAGPDGQLLPPISLNWCEFEANLECSRAKMTSFSLRGSRFRALSLKGAHIDGALDLQHCGPLAHEINGREQVEYFPFCGSFCDVKSGLEYETIPNSTLPKTDYYFKKLDEDVAKKTHLLPVDCKLSECLVLAEGISVVGTVRLSNSIFCQNLDTEIVVGGHTSKPKCVLDFAQAEIRDSVIAYYCVAIGKVDFMSAHIGEDIWLNQARLFGIFPNEPALKLQTAYIGGLLAAGELDKEISRDGFGTTIVWAGIQGLGLQVTDIWFVSTIFSGGWIDLSKANIAQSLTLGSYTKSSECGRTCINGGVGLRGANIGKNLELHHVSYRAGPDLKFLKSKTSDDDYIDAVTLGFISPFGRDKRLRSLDDIQKLKPYFSQLALDCKSIKVDRRVYVGFSSFMSFNGRDAAMDFWKSTIGTGFRIGEFCCLNGSLLINHSKIGREVVISCHQIGISYTPPLDPEAKGQVVPPNLPLQRCINMRASVVDGDVRIGIKTSERFTTKVDAPKDSAQKDAEVPRMPPTQMQLQGSLLLQGMRVAGSVRLVNVMLDLMEATQPIPYLDSSPQYRDKFSRSAPKIKYVVGHGITDKVDSEIVRFDGSEISGTLAVDIDKIKLRPPEGKHGGVVNEAIFLARAKTCLQMGKPVTARSLSFYDGMKFVEVETSKGSYRFLLDENVPTKGLSLFGVSAGIHKLNVDQEVLRFESEEQRSDYLAFFCDSIGTDDYSPFRIVSGFDALEYKSFFKNLEVLGDNGAVPKSEEPLDVWAHNIAKRIRERFPIGEKSCWKAVEPPRGKEDTWCYFGLVHYQNALFATTLCLHKTGIVEMFDDRPIAVGIARAEPFPLRSTKNCGPIRYKDYRGALKTDPHIVKHLREFIAEKVEVSEIASKGVPESDKVFDSLIETARVLTRKVLGSKVSAKFKAGLQWLKRIGNAAFLKLLGMSHNDTANSDAMATDENEDKARDISIAEFAEENRLRYVAGALSRGRLGVAQSNSRELLLERWHGWVQITRDFFGLDAARLPWRQKEIEFFYRINLSGLTCGFLNDHNGKGWGIRGCALRLTASGINCGRLESGHELEKNEDDEQVNTAKMSFAYAGAHLETDRLSSKDSASSGATERIIWLGRQFTPPVVPLENSAKDDPNLTYAQSETRLHIVDFWRFGFPKFTHNVADSGEYIPQAYHMFARAHRNAGDIKHANEILRMRKDIEYRVAYENVKNTIGKIPSFLPPSGRFGSLWFLLSPQFYAVAISIFWLVLQLPLFDSFNTQFVDLIGLGAVFSTIVVVALALSSKLFMAGVMFFRTGFGYALSATRSLLTLTLFIAVGAFVTQWMRTGEFFQPAPNWELVARASVEEDGAISRAATLPENVVLVLNIEPEVKEVHHEKDLQAQSQNRSEIRSPDMPWDASNLRYTGNPGIARASVCNLGVNSVLYAVDLFVPLIDLHQRKKCKIRDVEDPSKGDPYLLWRFGFALYEFFGWIVMSLLILTLTGIMKRDLMHE